MTEKTPDFSHKESIWEQYYKLDYNVSPPSKGGRYRDVPLLRLKVVDLKMAGLLLVPGKNQEGGSPYYTHLHRLIDKYRSEPNLLAMVLDMITPEEFEQYARSLVDGHESDQR